jgi:hypothetical protein
MILDPAIPIQASFVEDCPILSSIVMHYNNEWPEFARPLLNELITVCTRPFNVAPSMHTEATDSGLEFWQEGHWYPFWPRIRQAQQYSAYFTAVPTTAQGKVQDAHDKSKHCLQLPG